MNFAILLGACLLLVLASRRKGRMYWVLGVPALAVIGVFFYAWATSAGVPLPR